MMNSTRIPDSMNSNSNNDEAFMNLLASQRELLTQISRESTNHGAEGDRVVGSTTGAFDPVVSPNRSICEPMNDNEFVFSKRFSLGLGNDAFGYPTLVGDDSKFALGADLGLGYDIPPRTYNKGDKEGDLGGLEDFAGKKRRLSSIGFLNTFFHEDLKQRRFSFGPNERFQTFVDLPDEELLLSSTNLDPVEAAPPKKPEVDPKEAKKFMIALSDAMEKTQKTQQDIHDWDRKMGLKRSHSKTMRLSTRSRKKLRAMLKKQINALNSKRN